MTSFSRDQYRATHGYFAVTADFIHVGHIRAMRICKERCCFLIVGVMTDLCVKKYKGYLPIMTLRERIELVSSIAYVDDVVEQNMFSFKSTINRIKKDFNIKDIIIFDSDEHLREGTDIVIPRMKRLSSSLYKRVIRENKNSSQCEI